MRAARSGPLRSLAAGALLAALLSGIALTLVTQLWHRPLHVPFHETGWFDLAAAARGCGCG